MRYTAGMQVWQKLWRWPLIGLDRVLDRLLAVAGALVASQVPGYIQHYTQRLAGHLQEALLNVQGWQAIADATSGGSLADLTDIYLANPAEAVVAAGEKCVSDIERVAELQGALTALQEAGLWQRSLVFVRQCDVDIARQTLHEFVPNLPLNAEGLLYALGGMLLALGLYLVIKRAGGGLGRCLARRLRHRRVREIV
jgi:hypothetical protein